ALSWSGFSDAVFAKGGNERLRAFRKTLKEEAAFFGSTAAIYFSDDSYAGAGFLDGALCGSDWEGLLAKCRERFGDLFCDISDAIRNGRPKPEAGRMVEVYFDDFGFME